MKLILVAGARPNFMKIAPLIAAIKAHNAHNCSIRITPVLVHTGQHYDINMSRIFFEELGIPEPDVNLEVGSGSHAAQTANVMIRFEEICLKEKPDWVVVVGDVNSTMACTIVAAKLGIRVAHVEAGLRSFDRTMPEEINRLVTDSLADLLFTPSPDGDVNLRREGVSDHKIKRVGNIMIDSLMANLEKARNRGTYQAMGLAKKNFVYVTLHRPSNVDNAANLRVIMENLARLSEKFPVVFPVHPRTRKMLISAGIHFSSSSQERRKEDEGRRTVDSGRKTECGGERPDNRGRSSQQSETNFQQPGTWNVEPGTRNGFHIIDPIGYHDSICLAENARFVLTDSGGLQEETTFFQTPCLTLRPNTERPVTITEGSNRLTNPALLAADIEETLCSPPRLRKIPEMWDGRTAERILEILVSQRVR